ncbi:hypothetical protein WEN_01935 [Mycoplasma wenyonii str. Massachusetts]|uniref:Uncharacterized protein n=1 Tax=Mycoplasma wenyonii (strain Massachusetts) TaxID=1197325 RepID=I6ZIZ7_MYCWM|nr:hypothetical protein [Mycoplasma wenyonii]AFN65180.1 hypothetical protein WEN_01935 [Mycoplasma wenyonii str. Massachusetts]
MVAVKLISIPLTGIVGVLGSTSPLMHIGATRSNYKTKWYERADFSQPIFKNCIYESKNPLNIYLVIEGGATVSQDSKKVSLKALEKKGKEEALRKDIWEKLKLRYSGEGNKKVQLMYPYKSGSDDRWGMAKCDAEKIEFISTSSSFRDSEYVFLKDIHLTLEGKCKESFSSADCEISIKQPNNKIQWIKGFQPKVTYTAF